MENIISIAEYISKEKDIIKSEIEKLSNWHKNENYANLLYIRKVDDE